MKIVYDTFTGNTQRFINKLPSRLNVCHIDSYKGSEEFILVTYTIDFGEVPKSTEEFLETHSSKMIAVSSGGNKNWGLVEKGGTFGKAADIISKKYKVPIISKFELQGTDYDIEKFVQGVEIICQKQNGLN